jgi:hypothetical protein
MSTTSAVSIATSVPAPIAMPEIGLRERRCVVDAVADHRDDAAVALHFGDLVRFVAGEYLGNDSVDAELVRDAIRIRSQARDRALCAGAVDD